MLCDLLSSFSEPELSSLVSSVSEMLRFKESKVSSLFDILFIPVLGAGVGIPSVRFFGICENKLLIDPND